MDLESPTRPLEASGLLLTAGVRLRVSDLAASLAFYTQTLGLPLGVRHCTSAEVDAPGGLVIALDEAARLSAGTGADATPCIELRVDDLAQAMQVFEAQGLVFRVEEDPMHLRAHFTDPDGTALCLAERKC
jgi:catechol 2,3-dioxygenase-like lactoylglutathione lyase family enzyme